MCDTILATPATTAGGVMLFGKNSDRHRNEAQTVELVSPAEYSPGSLVDCTYLQIPQVSRTNSVLLCRPFWIWGAEMGANEHGVVIGNEGLHARSPAPQTPALTGMDLVRLALERCASAAEAVSLITTLLAQYGQGGDCGHLVPAFYNNGFMIADADEAFVLETIGREWLVEQVGGTRSLSNIYSVGREVASVSEGLMTLIEPWSDIEDATPDYADIISNPEREHIGNACARRARSDALLRSASGNLGVGDMIAILRDHGDGDDANWDPSRHDSITLCMHAGSSERGGQTTGSLVSEIIREGSVHWVTATAAPCISIFKPVLMDVPLPPQGAFPTGKFDARTLWWRHECLHRTALRSGLNNLVAEIAAERNALEAEFRDRIAAVLRGGSAVDRAQIVSECWRKASEVEDRWFTQLPDGPSSVADDYRVEWGEMDRVAGFERRSSAL